MTTPSRTDLGFEHVYEPGPGDGSGTTLLLLHSTGGDEHQLVGLGRAMAPDAALLSPRGQVLENGMARRFFARRSMTELDIPDLLARTDDLAAFVRTATGAYELDAGRLVALGYSNGANIAIGLLFQHPGLLAGAALLRPMLPYEPEVAPALEGTDVLVASASADPYTDAATSERLVRVLSGAGAEVAHHQAPAGHELTDADLIATRDWLADRT